MALTLASLENFGNGIRYKSGLGSTAGAVVVQTADVSAYRRFLLTHSSTGAGASMSVYPSLDGTNYVTSPLTLTDLGSTTAVPATVVATTADRVYQFNGVFAAVRVLQNGSSAAIPTNVCLVCGDWESR